MYNGYPSGGSRSARGQVAEKDLEQRPLSASSKAVSRAPLAGATGTCCGGVARIQALCSHIDTVHRKMGQALEYRLQEIRTLHLPWASGDMVALAKLLEASDDDAFTSGVLLRLTQYENLLPPRQLSLFIPRVQKLAQADHEDHAVAAMRFILHCLRFSWPSVAKSLRSVATPKATYDACNEAASRLYSLYAVVKAMSRSVRISRTNGPLVPLCRKTKVSLEEALAAAGRLRGG